MSSCPTQVEYRGRTQLNVFFNCQIDLKNADPERVEKQIEKVFDIPKEECIRVSSV